MKKLAITVAAALLATLSVNAQGTVNFSNIGAAGAITNGMTGQRAAVGTAIMVGLFFAQDGVTDPGAFQLVGAATGIGPIPGFFSGGTRTADITPPGSFGHFQVRAWESAFGTYADAFGRGLTGESGILRVDTGDPTTVPPGTPASLLTATVVSGRALTQGILLTVVPEPSTYALALLGLGLVVALRRRK